MKTKNMKNKFFNSSLLTKRRTIIISGIAILLLIGIVIAAGGRALEKPIPKYKILESYTFNSLNGLELCFKIEGYYPDYIPCFNSTEFVSADDAQSLINLHNRMAEIDAVNRINNERIEIYGQSCLSDLNCKGKYIGQEFVCFEGKCLTEEEKNKLAVAKENWNEKTINDLKNKTI